MARRVASWMLGTGAELALLRPGRRGRALLGRAMSSDRHTQSEDADIEQNSRPSDGTRMSTSFGFKQVPVHDKERLVKGVFDSVAARYDVMNDLMSGGLHRVWKDDFVQMSGISTVMRANGGGRGIRLLDVAGGTGDIAFRLMQRAVDAYPDDPPHITVCDINAEMLKVGQQRSQEAFRCERVRSSLAWVEGNAEKLPFPDNHFDLYTIAFGLRNVTNRAKALAEAYRVLKVGGRFMCLEFSHVSLPVAKDVYDLYSFEIIPRIGQAVTGNPEAYQYLVESIRQFPKQEDLVAEVEAAGFQGVLYSNYTMGTVAVHSGFKWG